MKLSRSRAESRKQLKEELDSLKEIQDIKVRCEQLTHENDSLKQELESFIFPSQLATMLMFIE